MAQSTLPSLNSHVHPVFQQLLDNLVGHEIHRVERVLGSCCYSNEIASCRERATVEEIETGLEYCLAHFEEAGRG